MEGKLPQGWIIVELNDVCLPTQNEDPRDSPNNEFKYVDISAIDNSRYQIVNPKIVQGIKAPSRARKKIEEGDTLFSTVRTNLKNIAYVSEEFNGEIASTGFAVIRPSVNVNNKFVFYYCISDSFVDIVSSKQTGASYPAIRSSDFFRQKIYLPPLKEQDRIVKKLDAAFDKLKKAEEILAEVPKMIENFRKSVLYHAVTGKLSKEWREETPNVKSASFLVDEINLKKKGNLKVRAKKSDISKIDLYKIPSTWSWTANHKLSKDKSNAIGAGPFGTIFKAKDFREKGVPIVFLRHVGAGEYLTHKPKFMDEKVWEEFHQPYSIYGGELLIAKLGEPPGQCTVYPEGIGKAMVTPDVIKMEVDDKIAFKEYLMYFFNSPIFKDMIAKVAFGMTRLRIDLGIFKNIPIPLPPKEEQKYIVEKVDSLMKAIGNIEVNYQGLILEVEQIRTSLLGEAFSGELVPQNSNDEPASALLEKIQIEKQKLEEELKAQRKKRRSQPKKKPVMKNLEIIEVLKISVQPMKAEEVWRESKYREDIDAFYEQLRHEVEIAKNVQSVVETNQETYLNLIENGN